MRNEKGQFTKGHPKPKGAYSFKKGNNISFKKGHIPWNKDIKTGITHWKGKKRNNISGENHYNWKDGISKREDYDKVSRNKWRKSHPEKQREISLRETKLRNKKLETMAGRKKPEQCEICGAMGKICFDHNHETGEFRGWICIRCNFALGFVKDNSELLVEMIKYLRKNEHNKEN